jgi:methyl-accepting chemotaxis protein
LAQIASGAEEAAGAAHESLAAVGAMSASFGQARERAEHLAPARRGAAGPAVRIRRAIGASVKAVGSTPVASWPASRQ